ncbi:MAG: sulfatase-like hydrolase/transferase [Rikenellaceae bacterium]
MNTKGICAAAAVATLVSVGAQAATQSRPNVVLIMCDDLIDFSGVYNGHPQAFMPSLDALAKQSVNFTNAHSVAPVSGPSRGALFTGIYPSVSENFHFTPWFNTPVLAHCKTFMGQLMEEGYDSYGAGKLMHHQKLSEYTEFGEKQNTGPLAYDGKKVALHPSVPEAFASIGPLDGTFGSLADVPTVDGYTGWWNTLDKKPFRYVNDEDRDQMGDEKIAQWAVNKLKDLGQGDSDKPFYLGVGFSKPHTALVAPQKYFDMYPLESIKLPDWVEGDADDTHFREVGGRTKGFEHFKAMQAAYGEDVKMGFRKYLQAYLACMSFVDDQIGLVLMALENSRFADNTIVIFTSDHGYDFGQKEHFFKNSLWGTSTTVPFLVRMPSGENAGRECGYPIALTDIYPTVLDYCGIKGDNRKNDKGAPLSGHSIRTFIENPKATEWGGAPVALSMVRAGGDPLLTATQNYAVKGVRYRYIHYVNGAEELYDCKQDPDELTNLAEDKKYRAVKAEMRTELLKLVPELGEPLPERKDMTTIYNGDFELSKTGWTGSYKIALTGDPRFVKSGKYSCSIAEKMTLSQQVDVVEGAKMTLSFDGRMTKKIGDGVVVGVKSGRDTMLAEVRVSGVMYKNYVAEFVVPKGVKKVTVAFGVPAGKGATNPLLIDNVKLLIAK